MVNQQNGCMKTTVDLPANLIKQVKLRAVKEGRKLKDAVADLLRKGLAAGESGPKAVAPVVSLDKQTGLPVIQCRRTPPPNEQVTPERIAEILVDQETERQHAAGG